MPAAAGGGRAASRPSGHGRGASTAQAGSPR